MHRPKNCSLFYRPDRNGWEARITLSCGTQKYICCLANKTEAHKRLLEAHKNRKKLKPTKAETKEKEFTLFAWLDHWYKTFREPKLAKGDRCEKGELAKNTLITDVSFIKRIKKTFDDMPLSKLTADYIQEKLNNDPLTRTCEGVYTALKLALEKAKSRTGGRSVMEQVEKVKHERKRGRALTKAEIEKLLEVADNQTEKDIIMVYIYTGMRVGEIDRVLVKHIDFANNEFYIDGTKTKGSRRTMPILPPLKPILERLVANRNGEEKLFAKHTINTIRNFFKLIKEKSQIKFTLKDLRHTCVTNCKDNGIPISVYFRWFGWSDDTMARKVYTHVTDFERSESQKWASKFSNAT
ncbi:MAG: site-specific integrase [Christensenellaceae bacterium]|nr:site-specific integrase [Christensenellaceae bacterium]